MNALNLTLALTRHLPGPLHQITTMRAQMIGLMHQVSHHVFLSGIVSPRSITGRFTDECLPTGPDEALSPSSEDVDFFKPGEGCDKYYPNGCMYCIIRKHQPVCLACQNSYGMHDGSCGARRASANLLRPLRVPEVTLPDSHPGCRIQRRPKSWHGASS